MNATTGCRHTTVWTVLSEPICKVLTVYGTVAIDAQCLAIRKIESKIGKGSPRLQMMRMEILPTSAALTRVAIATEYSNPPFPKPWCQAGTVSI